MLADTFYSCNFIAAANDWQFSLKDKAKGKAGLNRWMDGWLDGWPGRLYRWTDGWMAGWLDGWMAGWTKKPVTAVAQWRSNVMRWVHDCGLIMPKKKWGL